MYWERKRDPSTSTRKTPTPERHAALRYEVTSSWSKLRTLSISVRRKENANSRV